MWEGCGQFCVFRNTTLGEAETRLFLCMVLLKEYRGPGPLGGLQGGGVRAGERSSVDLVFTSFFS